MNILALVLSSFSLYLGANQVSFEDKTQYLSSLCSLSYYYQIIEDNYTIKYQVDDNVYSLVDTNLEIEHSTGQDEYTQFVVNFDCLSTFNLNFRGNLYLEDHLALGNLEFSFPIIQGDNHQYIFDLSGDWDINTYSLVCDVAVLTIEDFNGGYVDGYQNGYTDGKTDGNKIGYQNGYNTGFIDGNNEGFTTGRTTGYSEGFVAGANSTGNPSFMGLFGAIADTPILMLRSLFNFDLFGVPLLTAVLTFITATLLIWVVKKVIK